MAADSSLYLWIGADQRAQFAPLPELMLMMRESGFRSRSLITMRNQRGYGTQKNWMSVRQELLYYTKGAPKQFSRSDLKNPVTREFCGACGTHILAKASGLPGALVIKVGVFDDPSVFGGPQMAIYTIDKQSFHHIPDGVVAFERLPG